MYQPKHFVENDAQLIDALIAQNPLAQLIAQTAEGLVANPIPLMRRDARLIGHIARANDLHETVADGTPVLAIFMGVDGYISPNWYPSKAKTHRVVPTWNYQTVQIHGTIHWQHDPKAKRAAVGLLTAQMERNLNGEAAWKMANAPRDYLDEMLENIVAFEVAITAITAKSKLSQNKSPADRAGAAAGTQNSDLSRAMRWADKGE